MAPTLPKAPSAPHLPDAVRGTIYENVGKYARGAVLFAFDQIGGPGALADWARKNPDDFYTKLFPKIITKEVEVTEKRGVDELLDVLDGDYEVVSAEDQAQSAPDPPAAGPHLPGPDYDIDDLVDFEEA